MHFAIGDERAFLAWALGLGDAVEVVAPVRLREEMVRRLTAAAGPTHHVVEVVGATS
jgi:predicted DNA-binding transcriptional regulator YafY